MPDAVLVALITGAFSVLTAFIAVFSATRQATNKMQTSQAVMETKLDDLKNEVRKIGDINKDVPVMKEQLKSLDRRVTVLEKKSPVK